MQKNPLARALRIDKLTIAAFEATLLAYMDIEAAKNTVPVLKMLFQAPEEIKRRALKIAAALRKVVKTADKIVDIRVVQDRSKAGGGSLPEAEFQTFAVQIRSGAVSVNELERRLRQGQPPVIARIREDALLLDARTVMEQEIKDLASVVSAAFASEK